MVDQKKGTYTVIDKRGKNAETTSEAKKEETAPPQKTPSHPKRESPHQPQPSPKNYSIDFKTLIMSFATSAVVAMGKSPDPHTGQTYKDLDIAKQNIDIISLLKDKTQGNRTPEENNLVDGILYELHMIFMEASGGMA